jgi:AraC family transcriptional regulator
MSRSQAQKQGDYSTSNLFTSSDQLGWSTLFAELRTHSRREGPGTAAPLSEVAIALRSSAEMHVTSKIDGTWRSVRPTAGTIWLCPIGAKADEISIGAPEPQDLQVSELQVIHLYISNAVFAHLADDYNLPSAPGRSVRYSCGVRDEIINQIGAEVLQEMMYPTAAGRILIDTSSLLLAARLLHTHSETGLTRPPFQSRHRLDERRLRRVLTFVEEHLADEISVTDLANVACLSVFHFTRAFAATMGVPPHRYLGQRRLESAKIMIAAGSKSFDEIATACRFSSLWSFARAFRRATGMTPAEYQRTLR